MCCEVNLLEVPWINLFLDDENVGFWDSWNLQLWHYDLSMLCNVFQLSESEWGIINVIMEITNILCFINEKDMVTISEYFFMFFRLFKAYEKNFIQFLWGDTKAKLNSDIDRKIRLLCSFYYFFLFLCSAKF